VRVYHLRCDRYGYAWDRPVNVIAGDAMQLGHFVDVDQLEKKRPRTPYGMSSPESTGTRCVFSVDFLTIARQSSSTNSDQKR
jgi:hypothetical protein